MKRVNKKNTCASCGKEHATTICDHCGKPICKECSMLEIWGTGAEDLSAKYLCSGCKENPDINPWGAHTKAPDNGEVLHLFDEKDAGHMAKAA